MDKNICGGQNRQRHNNDSKTNQRIAKKERSIRRGEPHIKKSDCHIHAALKQRLTAVHTLRFQHSITILCRVLNVNRSTYYKHFKEKIAPRTIENQALKSDILSIYSRSKKRLGGYKIRQRLIVEYGKKISVGRVYRLMKSMSLPKISTTKPKYSNIKPQSMECKNVLNQKFNPIKPNLVWVSDITYVKVAGKFCYICVIIDLYARKVIGYKTSIRMDTQLVLDAFSLTYSKRNYPKGVLFHTDRGSQYTSHAFRKAIDNAEFVQSFSAKGHPYDNAVAESFFKYLKQEELNRRSFNSIHQLNLSLFEYIVGFYNKSRPHSANNFLSPDEKEDYYFNL